MAGKISWSRCCVGLRYQADVRSCRLRRTDNGAPRCPTLTRLMTSHVSVLHERVGVHQKPTHATGRRRPAGHRVPLITLQLSNPAGRSQSLRAMQFVKLVYHFGGVP